MKLRLVPALVVSMVAACFSAMLSAAPPPQRTNPLAGPVKAEKDARLALDKAKAQLLVIRKKIAVSFESKPDWKAAKDAFEQSRVAYELSQKRLIGKLELNPEYKALEVKRDKAQAIADQGNVKTAPSSDDVQKLTEEDIANAQRERTEASFAMKKIQKEAEENDPGILAAKQKFEESRQAWEAMQSQLDEAVKTDPDYKPASEAIEQADTAWKAARDQLAAAAKSQRAAEAAAIKRH